MATSSPPTGNASPQTSSDPAAGGGRSRRRVRGYLVDPRFQLKYTGLLVGVVVAVMVSLGYVIWQTANTTSAHAEFAAEQAEKALKESQTSSRLVRMNTLMQAQDDDPELVQTIEKELKEVDREAERNLADVKRRRADVELQRHRLLQLLVASGASLVLLLGMMGIFITHRIVGPVFKLKRLLRQVSTSRLSIKERLRKGDELEDLFDTFLQMTYSLQALQAGRLATLDATIKKAEASQAAPEVMQGLRALRAQLCLGLPSDPLRPAPKA